MRFSADGGSIRAGFLLSRVLPSRRDDSRLASQRCSGDSEKNQACIHNSSLLMCLGDRSRLKIRTIRFA
jgi:hypothetical protein